MSDVAIGSGAGASPPAPVEEGQASLARRLFAEFTGTTVFVAVGTGAATILATGPIRSLAAIPPEALGGEIGEGLFGSLLGFTFGDLLGVAFAFATALAVLVYAFGGVSGAHFNPAVTVSLAVARRFRWGDVPAYLLVQCIGGIAGAFIVAGIYGQSGAALEGQDIFFGATTISADLDWVNGLLAEAFIGFILVTGIMAVAVDPRAPKGWSGLVIGLALAAGILVTADATGGSANFARSLGPFVTSLFYDTGEIPWDDLIIYGIGPMIGGAAAALVYESITGLETEAPAPQPGAATPPGDEIIGDNGLIEEGGTAPFGGPSDPPPPDRL
jgi:glycerol uptake facilitator protein